MAVCGGESPPSPSIGLGLMSCVKIHPQDHPPVHHHEGKKKGFHPLRGLRRIFRRMQRTSEAKAQPSPVVEPRSRSASQLLDQTVNVVHSGLSVSHDSVFCPSQHSVASSSFSSHQLPQHTSITAELANVVRRRREHGENSDIDDNDFHTDSVQLLTTADIPSEHNTKDSRTSLKFSSQDKALNHFRDTDDLSVAHSDISPLSHSAARHKMAVRPKRKHAATRHRSQLVPLPATPEVNEESVTVFTSEQETTDSLPLIKDVSNKSASLPAGVTPVNSWNSSSQDGFFTRLLSRRSGKNKKNVESRQRIQPLTIPASSNLPKSQSFRQDDKLPFEFTDTPSLPNIEATSIWVSPQCNISSHDPVVAEPSPDTETTSVWVSQPTEEVSESIENNLLISVSLPISKEVDSDVILNVQDDIDGIEADITKSENRDDSEKPVIENEYHVSLNSPTILQNGSVVSINIDSIQEKYQETNEDYESKNESSDKTETSELIHFDFKGVMCSETSLVLKEIDINKEEKHDPETVATVIDNTVSNVNQKNDSNLESSIISSASPKNEEFKFEIKSMSDDKKHTEISLGDRKLSLSELSSLFEKETENSTKIVMRQKSYSFSKQSTTSKETTLRQFDGIPKDDKQIFDVHKNKLGSSRKNSENGDSFVVLPSEIKHQEKRSEYVDVNKQPQTGSEIDVLKRRSSREVLKQKEEEPELLKVFARRSLKVKDLEEDAPVKSRESDKENEDSIAERKKGEYQRSISTEDCILSVHNVCRQRSKTLPELSHRKPINIYKETESLNIEKEDSSEEHQFIRIQQRKEVWEKRAQQAMGK